MLNCNNQIGGKQLDFVPFLIPLNCPWNIFLKVGLLSSWDLKDGDVGVEGWFLPRAPSHPPLSPHLTHETGTEGQPTPTHDQLWLQGKKHLYSNQILPFWWVSRNWVTDESNNTETLSWGCDFSEDQETSERILKCNFVHDTNTGLKVCLCGVCFFYWIHLFSSHLQAFLLCFRKVHLNANVFITQQHSSHLIYS